MPRRLRDAADELTTRPQSPTSSRRPRLQAAPSSTSCPVGTVVTTPDGSQYLIRSARPGSIAPTSPSRSTARPSTELDAARQRFAAELPAYVAEIQDRALLRGR